MSSSLSRWIPGWSTRRTASSAFSPRPNLPEHLHPRDRVPVRYASRPMLFGVIVLGVLVFISYYISMPLDRWRLGHRLAKQTSRRNTRSGSLCHRNSQRATTPSANSASRRRPRSRILCRSTPSFWRRGTGARGGSAVQGLEANGSDRPRAHLLHGRSSRALDNFEPRAGPESMACRTPSSVSGRNGGGPPSVSPRCSGLVGIAGDIRRCDDSRRSPRAASRFPQAVECCHGKLFVPDDQNGTDARGPGTKCIHRSVVRRCGHQPLAWSGSGTRSGNGKHSRRGGVTVTYKIEVLFEPAEGTTWMISR